MVTDKVHLGATMSAAVVRQGLPEVRFEEGLKEVWRGGGHRSMEVGKGEIQEHSEGQCGWGALKCGFWKGPWELEKAAQGLTCGSVPIPNPTGDRRKGMRPVTSSHCLRRPLIKPFPEWRELGH